MSVEKPSASRIFTTRSIIKDYGVGPFLLWYAHRKRPKYSYANGKKRTHFMFALPPNIRV
jgi:hypothetical protein